MFMSRQCPNCGGYKVETNRLFTAYPKSDMPPGKILRSSFGYGLFLAVASMLTTLGLFYAGIIDLGYVTIGLSVVAPSVFVLTYVIGYVRFRRRYPSKKQKPLYTMYSYSCQICGFKWSWQDNEGYPYPAKTRLAPNADELLRKGNELLAQQQRIAMMAAAHEQQKRAQRERGHH